MRTTRRLLMSDRLPDRHPCKGNGSVRQFGFRKLHGAVTRMHVNIPTAHFASSLLATSPAPPVQGQFAEESPSKKSKKSGNPELSSIQDTVHLSGMDQELAQLKARDREVRAHEAAHAAAAGSVATGGPQFTFTRGSDGRLYAVGGEVNIDTSTVPNDPEATIRKAQTIRTAALAPANPSAQDRAVAAQASQMEAQARRELQQERTEDIQNITREQQGQSPPLSQIIDLLA